MDLARFVSGVSARLRVPSADVTLFWTGIRCTCQHVCGQWRAQAETERLSRCRARLKEGRARTRKGRSWASAATETWWCFTGQAPTVWPVLVFLPGVANFIWLRPSGWMSWLKKLAGVAVCSQCLLMLIWSRCTLTQPGNVCEKHCVAFVPLVVETNCVWAPEASKILHQLPLAVTLWTDSDGRGFCSLACPPLSRSGLFFLIAWGVPFLLFGGRPAQTLVFPSIQK